MEFDFVTALGRIDRLEANDCNTAARLDSLEYDFRHLPFAEIAAQVADISDELLRLKLNLSSYLINEIVQKIAEHYCIPIDTEGEEEFLEELQNLLFG